MKKYLNLLSSFTIMLCIGSIYAWSIIASELVDNYSFSASQSQIIFGVVILTFPLTMIITGRLRIKHYPKLIGYLSGLFFSIGYLLASFSHGSFALILLGTGVLAGIGTGLGYWLALTYPVQCFPNRKGLITGIVSAGFGLGAVFMSEIAERILLQGFDILYLMRFLAILYGIIILFSSNFIYAVCKLQQKSENNPKFLDIVKSTKFLKLFIGIFLGTFAGLLIIGSLRMIGKQLDISNHIIVFGIGLFAIANFFGRIFWGFLSDYFKTKLIVFSDLFIQALAIIALLVFNLSNISYLIIIGLIGFGFGGNFVLFAKETAQLYGVKKLGQIYPYVFMGYAIAGITGPFSGGHLFDITGSYTSAIILASIMSLCGGLLFLLSNTSKEQI